jgi:hypothetical protein
MMRSRLILIGMFLSFILFLISAQEGNDNSNAKAYNLVLDCSLSGGMQQVHYKNRMFIITKTVRKKNDDIAVHGNLRSFVEIQRRTMISNSEVELLYDWVEKYGITQVKKVQKPQEETPDAVRYENVLEIQLDSKKYTLDHYTIGANPELREAFEDLFALGKRFTATE